MGCFWGLKYAFYNMQLALSTDRGPKLPNLSASYYYFPKYMYSMIIKYI